MGQKVELTKEIAAPPETVFRALTDADELSRWWTSSADSDPRKGGAFEYRFEFPDQPDRDHTYSGAYDEFVANERVAYPWHYSAGVTKVDVALRPAGDGTELRLVHSGWPESTEGTDAARMHEEGWGFFLENLKTWLERGEDRRADAMGMKTTAAARG